MNARLTLKVIQQGQALKNFALAPNAGQNGQALVLQASKGARYQLSDALTFTSPEKLQIKRVGQDLLIALPGNDVGSPDIIIRGYFSAEGVSLTGLAPTGEPMVYDAGGSGVLAVISGTGVTPINAQTVQAEQTLPVALSKVGGGWFDSGWSLAALAGGGLLIAAAGGGSDGGSASTTSAGLAKITTYKADSTKAVPSVADYEEAGVKGVDNTNVAGINSYVYRTQLPLTSAASVQSLVDSYNKVLAEANGSAADATPTSDPSLSDHVNLMGANLPTSVSRKSAALSLLNDRLKALNASDVDTYLKLKGLADTVDAVSQLTEASPSPATSSVANLTASQFTSLGVDGALSGNLSAYADAIRQAPDDMGTLGTTAKLSALVKAYNTILAEANGSAADATSANPTVADYTAIHASIGAAATDAQALDRLNAIVGNLASTAVDTVDEINKLAATLDKVLSVAALATGATLSDAQKFSAEELKNLGLSGFSGTEIQNTALALKVSEAIRDKAASEVVNGTGTGSRLVNGVITSVDQTQLENLQSLVSFELIRGYKLDSLSNSSVLPAPTASDWQNIGVFKSLADGSGKSQVVTASDTTALNDAINTLRKPGTAAANELVDSTTKVRAIAQSYLGILNEANGSASNFASDGVSDLNPNPQWIDHLRIGVTRKDGGATESTLLTKLLNSVVAEKTNAQVDTVAELQNLVNLGEELLALPGNAAAASLSADKLGSPSSGSDGLGLRGVTTANLADVNSALKALATSAADTFGELQSTVSLVRIKRYADNGTPSDSADRLSFQDWSTLRLSDGSADGQDLANEIAANLDAYNSAVNAFSSADITGVGTSPTDTSLGSLQALVNSYNKVLNKANGSAIDTVASSQISEGDYRNIGLNLSSLWSDPVFGSAAVKANALSLFNDAIGHQSSTAVDSLDELTVLAGSVSLLVRQADKANGVVTPQSSAGNSGPLGGFSNDLGLTLADLNRLGFETTKLSNFTNDSNDLNNVWAAIQNMDAPTLTYQMIQNAITQYAG